MCDSLLPLKPNELFWQKGIVFAIFNHHPHYNSKAPPPPITLHNAPLEVVLASLNRDHCGVELHYGTRRSAMGLFLESLETLSLTSLL